MYIHLTVVIDNFTVDSLIFVDTNFRGLNKNDIFVDPKFVVLVFYFIIHTQITISWTLEFVDRTLHETIKIGTGRNLSHQQIFKSKKRSLFEEFPIFN